MSTSTSSTSEHEPLNCLLRTQATVQTYARPAIWVPGIRALRMIHESWEVQAGSPAEWITNILKMAALQADKKLQMKGRRMILVHTQIDDKKRTATATIQCFTKAGWLDLLELTAREDQHDQSKVKVEVYAYSTGFLPLLLPGAALFNMCLPFVFFSDGGMCKRWLDILRDAGVQAKVLKSNRVFP